MSVHTYALRNVRNTLPLAATFGILIKTRSSFLYSFVFYLYEDQSRSRKGFTISVPLFVHNNCFFAPSLLSEDTTSPKLIHACVNPRTQKREIANTVGADSKQEFEFIRHLRVILAGLVVRVRWHESQDHSPKTNPVYNMKPERFRRSRIKCAALPRVRVLPHEFKFRVTHVPIGTGNIQAR
ncbi:hypothetical protein ALC60_07341 [Trachymyrmex zeteki]|uniref:Uncharacterized protein n=1 Tax=Mycetomoellerius zeteki TaxID=64791 RepID=A0A151X036_9HYME|nr:hypothetical protein ALC60_07341 [Trachymyrmex zeteki]